jgi:hypothetical protein
MSTRSRKVTTLPPSVSRFPRQYGILNILQTYGPPRPVTGIALLHLPFIPVTSAVLTEPLNKKNSVARVRERTIPAERLPLAGEDSANIFADIGVSRS